MFLKFISQLLIFLLINILFYFLFGKSQEVMGSVIEMIELAYDLETSGIDGMTAAMTTKFSEALKNAVKIKLKVPVFDSFETKVK